MIGKKHFDDLTEIDTVPAFLTADTLARLNAWPHGVELWDGAAWVQAPWKVESRFSPIYRARPAPLTQDVVPWHLLDDRLKVAARQSDGVAHAAESIQPVPYGSGFAMQGPRMRIDLLKGYQRGTFHWMDSLQKRPEGV